jgi:hypothetical protein
MTSKTKNKDPVEAEPTKPKEAEETEPTKPKEAEETEPTKPKEAEETEPTKPKEAEETEPTKPKPKTKDPLETIQKKLRQVKNQEGMIGYILRGKDSASIDLNDPTKIIDYAILSTTIFETGQEMSTMYEIGNVDSIVLESQNAKVLSLEVCDHRLSVFMEQNVDHQQVQIDLGIA